MDGHQGKASESSPMEMADKILLQPYEYLLKTPGKAMRSKLIHAFNDAWFGCGQEAVACITEVVDMLHTASLLIDDIQDDSQLRRGIPVAHKIYGIPFTINCGNYVFFLAFQRLRTSCAASLIDKAMGIMTDEMIELHRGQGMELWHRDNLVCPSEEDYYTMVRNKTGGLFRLAVRLMHLMSTSPPPLDESLSLVNDLGILYQIRDDYINLVSTDYALHKTACEDLTEGKFSFPILHAIRTAKRTSSDPQLLHILKQRTTNEHVKRYAVTLMQDAGSFAYTLEALRQREAEVRRRADALTQATMPAAANAKQLAAVQRFYQILDKLGDTAVSQS